MRKDTKMFSLAVERAAKAAVEMDSDPHAFS